MVDILKLAKFCTVKKYESDDFIFHEGDPGEDMFIILAGRVGVLINSIEGSPISVTELKAGDFFGEMSLLEGVPRSASIQALEDTTVILINKANFENVIVHEPSIAYRIMKGLSRRLRKQNEEIIQLKPCTEKTADNQSENDLAGSQQSDSPDGLEKTIFPLGRPDYNNVTAQKTDEDYLFEKEIQCPVCNHTFKASMVRSSKLNVQKIDYDFRRHYLEFEPLWYNIWVCPHCFYAKPSLEFEQIDEKERKFVSKNSKVIKNEIDFAFSNPRRLNEVIISYYIALYWVKNTHSDPGKMGRLWLNLAWLYEDAGDPVLANISSSNALENFKEFHFNNSRSTKPEQDQQLSLLIGELCLRNGQREEARQFFHNSIMNKGGSSRMNEQARDRVRELKK